MKNVFALVLIFLALPFISFGWGKTGHHIVAEVASNYMTENTKKNVIKYLNGMSFDDASTWMDDMRSNHSFDYMKPYHYIDFDKGSKVKELSGDNIISVLNRTIKELDKMGTLSNEQIKTDLCYLFHLVGDLHQPLHVGYPFDKGGNLVKVEFNGQSENLHWVWDNGIIEWKKITLDSILKNKFSEQQVKDLQKINVVEWATSSHNYLEQVYAFQNDKIDYKYVDVAYPIIEKQITIAGIRLAGILNHFFDNIKTEELVMVTTSSVSVVSEDKVAECINKKITVCTTIHGTHVTNGEKPLTMLNCGAAYPNQKFVAVIFNEALHKFKYSPSEYLDGKNVCITGTVKLYKGKPEVIIEDPSQIEIK